MLPLKGVKIFSLPYTKLGYSVCMQRMSIWSKVESLFFIFLGLKLNHCKKAT